MVGIAGLEIGVIQVAGALGVSAAAVVGLGIGTGRIKVGDLLKLDLSGGNGPQEDVQETKDRVQQIQEEAGEQLSKKDRLQIGREIGHALRLSYNKGKMEGEMQAQNEDKHFKVSMIAMLAAVGALLSNVAVITGVV